MITSELKLNYFRVLKDNWRRRLQLFIEAGGKFTIRCCEIPDAVWIGTNNINIRMRE